MSEDPSEENLSATARAVCVLPRGTEEGTERRVGREFTVAANRPLSFTLLSSLSRPDAVGDVVDLDEDSVHRHSPLVTELRFGRRSRQPDVRVVLDVRFTELGTLELWVLAPDTGHRWRLQFQLRGAARGDDTTGAAAAVAIDSAALEQAGALVRETFVTGRLGATRLTRDADGATRRRCSASGNTRGRSRPCARWQTCSWRTPRDAGCRRATRAGG